MNEDSDFFENLNDFFEMMQHEISRIIRDQLESGNLSNMPNFIQHGFKIEIGPDGPKFVPMNQTDMQKAFVQQNQSRWEKPYTEAFVIENGKRYQIVAEMPGIETEDVKIHFKDNTRLLIQAEIGEYRYRKGLKLKHPVDPDTLNFEVRNGVLEMFLNIIAEKVPA